MRRPRIAIAHDYITQRGGAERVVLSLARAFPDAEIHTLLYEPSLTYPEFAGLKVHTSSLNRLGFVRRDHRRALPLLEHATRGMMIDADLTIVSSSGWAHGIPTAGKKLVYCHSPARWLYLGDEYLGSAPFSSLKGIALTALRPALVRWDQAAARTADLYLANSSTVRERISRVYGMRAPVLFPPMSVTAAGPQQAVPEALAWNEKGERFYLVVSRLLPYKNVDAVIESFRQLPTDNLLVIGDGPEWERLQREKPGNVRMVRGLSDDQMRWAYSHATALIAASFEDFGLTPLEANAYGTPVLALRAGGFLDTVNEGVNGIHFDYPTSDHITRAVTTASGTTWSHDAIRQHADTFSESRFISAIRGYADCLLDQ